MRRQVRSGLLFLVGLLGACGSDAGYSPPDQATPKIQAEQARLAEVLGQDFKIVGSGEARCEVFVLGQRHGGSTSFVFTSCEATDGWERAALYARVDGNTVRVPQDGSGYARSLRHLFPSEVAEWAIDHPSGPGSSPPIATH